ncbi:hypothetical protein E2C01_087130 [Portunus trituberculatus]|uniref:Uncharacterized protein n=1 Tax=Portunus trituberculatus TaxID=210409 RepID=A0A5B7JGG7_PORTR|nr:hypothetical protein [Portunus trituberculatus]
MILSSVCHLDSVTCQVSMSRVPRGGLPPSCTSPQHQVRRPPLAYPSPRQRHIHYHLLAREFNLVKIVEGLRDHVNYEGGVGGYVLW